MPAEILFLSYCPLATDLSGCLLTEGDAKKPDVHPALDLVLDRCLFSAHYREYDRPVPVCMDGMVAFFLTFRLSTLSHLQWLGLKDT